MLSTHAIFIVIRYEGLTGLHCLSLSLSVAACVFFCCFFSAWENWNWVDPLVPSIWVLRVCPSLSISFWHSFASLSCRLLASFRPLPPFQEKILRTMSTSPTPPILHLSPPHIPLGQQSPRRTPKRNWLELFRRSRVILSWRLCSSTRCTTCHTQSCKKMIGCWGWSQMKKQRIQEVKRREKTRSVLTVSGKWNRWGLWLCGLQSTTFVQTSWQILDDVQENLHKVPEDEAFTDSFSRTTEGSIFSEYLNNIVLWTKIQYLVQIPSLYPKLW